MPGESQSAQRLDLTQPMRFLRNETALKSSEKHLMCFLKKSLDKQRVTKSFHRQSSLTDMSVLIPMLLKHSSIAREEGGPHSIFEPTSGATLSKITTTYHERGQIFNDVGMMARGLASLTSPRGTFGFVSGGALPVSATASNSPPASETRGSQTWTDAFQTLLENLLRDGEDMAVVLPYEKIRTKCQSFSWTLDAVTVPRLVIMDIGDEHDVCVEQPSEEEKSRSKESLKMTSLQSWSLGVFGDPLLTCCIEALSDEFLDGWDEGGEDIIEDRDNAGVRLLLYICYRAVVDIVTEHFRPRADSSKRELAGRRRLTSALESLDELEAVEYGALKRRLS